MISTANSSHHSQIHAINANAGVFTPDEVRCVDDIFAEYIQKGAIASGYEFLVALDGETVLGYACFGPRPLTQGTYDLYWIAVDPHSRQKGVGRALLTASEENVRQSGGHLLFVETSGSEKYHSTRQFYHATGYLLEATIRDFYQPGDDLVIFTKHL